MNKQLQQIVYESRVVHEIIIDTRDGRLTRVAREILQNL